MARFGRVLTAMVTPFHADGSLDVDGAVQLARWLQEQGNDGLVVSGTTGEAPVLSDEERLELFEAVVGAVTIPIVVGTGSNDTAHSVNLTAQAAKLGAAAALAVCPYYNRPSQAGIEAHLDAIATASDLPVIVYDIPVRTGRKIATDTLLRLARRHANVVGLKDAAGNPGETARVVAEAPGGFEVFSGDDSFTLPLLAVGATAVIGVATHWTAPDHVEMFDAWERGDTGAARAANSRMLESFAFETGDEAPNPIPTKAMLRTLGLPSGPCRLPMGPEPDWVEGRARQVYAALVAARG